MFGKKESRKTDAINVNSLIDFTLLDPRATIDDIEKLCDVAYKNEYYAVCVNPCFVKFAKGYIAAKLNNALKVVCVVGFPLGANTIETKVCEARQAVLDGADEVDVVINIGRAKAQDYDYVLMELKKIRKAVKGYVFKTILEICYFDENEIVKLCKVALKAGADYVKTSTGFGTAGANEKIVSLMLGAVAGKCFVKASGGIRTREQAIAYAELGVKRIGTSSVI